DRAVEAQVLRLVGLRLTALTQFLDDAVVGERRSWLNRAQLRAALAPGGIAASMIARASSPDCDARQSRGLRRPFRPPGARGRRRRQPARGPGGAHGGGPGAEVLGGQLAARDAAQIAVHVAGADAPRLPAGIEIAEQLLPRQFLAAAQDPAEPRVLQAHRVVLA